VSERFFRRRIEYDSALLERTTIVCGLHHSRRSYRESAFPQVYMIKAEID